MKFFKIQLIALLSILFMVGCNKEDDNVSPLEGAPLVTSTNPVSDQTEVGMSNIISVSFNMEMDPASLTSSTFTLSQAGTNISGTVDYQDSTAIFTPDASLEANKVYVCMISENAKNKDGISLGVDYSFTFTTGAKVDVIMPTISSTYPEHNTINIARNQAITIKFSEAMNHLTINASTFTLRHGTNSISGKISYSDSTAKFTPNEILQAGKTYFANITNAQDLGGNKLATNKEWSFTTGGSTVTLDPVSIGTAGNYVILAKTAINNSSTSTITGDLALSPAAASYITGLSITKATGFATSAQVTGKIYAADMADPTPVNLTTAVENMITAYNDAAGRPSPDFFELGTGNIGGKTLVPGLYKWTNTVTLPSDITISGGENDVWIFQIAGDLTMSSAVNITLEGGAQAKNIFWQVAGETTIGTSAHFEGIILCMTGITFQTDASLKGRALAQTAVMLDKNVVTKP